MVHWPGPMSKFTVRPSVSEKAELSTHTDHGPEHVLGKWRRFAFHANEKLPMVGEGSGPLPNNDHIQFVNVPASDVAFACEVVAKGEELDVGPNFEVWPVAAGKFKVRICLTDRASRRTETEVRGTAAKNDRVALVDSKMFQHCRENPGLINLPLHQLR
jgi:hypothetical protein